MLKKEATTSIRLDTETGQRLDFLAAWTGRPKAFLLRELIKRGLDVEEYYLAVEWLGASKTAFGFD